MSNSLGVTHISDSRLPTGAEFHERIASAWTAGYASGGFARRLACFRTILKRQVRPGQRWLDLGCGSGVLTRELMSLGAHVVAVDGSPEMLRQAQRFIGSEDEKKVTWIQSDVEALPRLSINAFDGVLCSSVIEYVEYPSALMREAFRVLRPDGSLVISLPPRWAAVRTAQKVVRKIRAVFGSNRHTYLSVSKFEIAPQQAARWLDGEGFLLDQVTAFDPVLPRALSRVLRPSLLVLEAHKKEAA